MRKRFYRHEHIERRAAERLGELASKLGRELAPPIPIELLGEQVLGLDLLWDDIDEMPGEVIFAGLRAGEALVVLNERRRAVLEEKSGLHRFTVGHEFGHLICSPCNRGLAAMRDDPVRLRAAADYLERYLCDDHPGVKRVCPDCAESTERLLERQNRRKARAKKAAA